MNIYRIPIYWTMAGFYYVEAESEEEAKSVAESASLPNNGDYLDHEIDPDGQTTEWVSLTALTEANLFNPELGDTITKEYHEGHD